MAVKPLSGIRISPETNLSPWQADESKDPTPFAIRRPQYPQLLIIMILKTSDQKQSPYRHFFCFNEAESKGFFDCSNKLIPGGVKIWTRNDSHKSRRKPCRLPIAWHPSWAISRWMSSTCSWP